MDYCLSASFSALANSVFCRKGGIRSLVRNRPWPRVCDRSCGVVATARRASRPVGFEEERFDAGAFGGQLNLGYGNGAVSEAIANDEKIVTARFVEAHRPALVYAVSGQSLRVVADHAKGALARLGAGRVVRPLRLNSSRDYGRFLLL